MLRLLLERDGHDVCAVTSAGDALDALNEREFDVVLSELSIEPPVDGLALAAYVRRTSPNTQFVLATGAPSPQQRYSRASGVDDVLAKPYRLAELRRVVAAPKQRGLVSPLPSRQGARRRAMR